MPRPTIDGREARVKLPTELYTLVRRDARASGNSIAAQVRTALTEYYRNRGEKLALAEPFAPPDPAPVTALGA